MPINSMIVDLESDSKTLTTSVTLIKETFSNSSPSEGTKNCRFSTFFTQREVLELISRVKFSSFCSSKINRPFLFWNSIISDLHCEISKCSNDLATGPSTFWKRKKRLNLIWFSPIQFRYFEFDWNNRIWFYNCNKIPY